MYEGSNPHAKFLYYLAKFWGMAPFKLKNNRISCESPSEKVTSIIIGAWFVLAIVIFTTERLISFKTDGIALGGIALLIWMQLKFISVITCLITFVRERETIVDIISSFFDIDQILRSFGIVQDYENFFKTRAILVAICSVILALIEYVTSLVYWCSATEKVLVRITIDVFAIKLIDLAIHLRFIIFVNVMVSINERIQIINDSLQNVCDSGPKPHRINNFVDRRATNSIEVNLTPLEKLEQIALLCDKLRDLTDKTIKLFSLPMFTFIATHFLHVLNACWYLFSVTQNSIDVINYQAAASQLSVSISTLADVLELVAVAFVCSSAQILANSTPTVLHRMWIKCGLAESKNEVGLQIYSV